MADIARAYVAVNVSFIDVERVVCVTPVCGKHPGSNLPESIDELQARSE